MTVSLDARTPSASVHALSGSTPPGAGTTMQPFGIATNPIHEMPDTFMPIGVPAADVVAGLAVRRAAAAHPDAEVIDLAERVNALAERERALWSRVSRTEDAAEAITPPAPIRANIGIALANEITIREDGARVLSLIQPTGFGEADEASRAAHAVALAEHERQEAEIGVRLGLPRWEKLAGRASARLARWGARLATLAPQTQTGLRAKVEASTICTKGEVYSLSGWRKDLATSISTDALRIIGAEADARAEQDRQADGELFHYGRRWEAADLEHRTADAAMEASWHSFIASAPAIPEEMFVSEEDHHRVGPYVRPHGVDDRMWYGDPDTLKMLREGYPKDISADRRAEILAANDRWVAANDAARREARCDALEAAEEAAATRENTARRAMLLTPAHTMDGLLLKARAAMSQWGGSDYGLTGLERKLRAAINGDATDEAAMAVLVDLARMASAEPAAIPAPGTASNLRPVRLPADLSALRLGADAAGDVREWYRSWLYAELRLLNLELDGSTEGSGIRQDNPGAAFHYPAEASWTDVPKPSTRAAAVLGLLGILPRHDGTGDLARVA